MFIGVVGTIVVYEIMKVFKGFKDDLLWYLELKTNY
jgi:hypothetical protein